MNNQKSHKTDRDYWTKFSKVLMSASIISGTAIGVGLITMPIISINMWSAWSIILLLVTIFIAYTSGCYIVELYMNHPPSSAFNGMIRDLLGKRVAFINDFLMVLCSFILLYAYSVLSGNILSGMMLLPPWVTTSFYLLLMAVIISLDGNIIGKVSSILMLILLIYLVIIIQGLFIRADVNNIISQPTEFIHAGTSIFYAIPFFLAACGYQQTIPNIRYVCNNEKHLIIKSIKVGTVFLFGIYALWLLVIMATSSRDLFLVSTKNAESLVFLSKNMNSSLMFDVFQLMLVTTSFIGIGRGIFDSAKRDYLKGKGTCLPICILFLPLAALSLLLPSYFLFAISLVGLFGVIWAAIIPYFAIRKQRKLLALDTGQHEPKTLRLQRYVFILYCFVFIVCYFVTTK